MWRPRWQPWFRGACGYLPVGGLTTLPSCWKGRLHPPWDAGRRQTPGPILGANDQSPRTRHSPEGSGGTRAPSESRQRRGEPGTGREPSAPAVETSRLSLWKLDRTRDCPVKIAERKMRLRRIFPHHFHLLLRELKKIFFFSLIPYRKVARLNIIQTLPFPVPVLTTVHYSFPEPFESKLHVP